MKSLAGVDQSRQIIIGKNVSIDDHVLLAYPVSRSIPTMTLRIGDHSKIRSGTVLYAGSKIGSRLETGHNVIIREQNDIGNDVKIWSNSVIDYGCKIRNNVKIHCGCYVAQQTIIEDNVFMAPGVTIANEKYPTGYYRSARIQAPVIKRGAKLGINATILPGVVIGRDAIVGAGSVVTRDVPAQATVYGNPARPCKTKDANVNW